MGVPRIEVDGAPATAEQLAYPAVVNYGHFTAMQVRGGGVRGLDLHLSRLDSATRELFGAGLDGGLVRAHVRHALAGAGLPDASVRVSVFQPGEDQPPSVMVVVRPPVPPPAAPQRLTTVAYERPAAHLKHAGTFGQIWHGRAAERAGFDDALLTRADGAIAESTTANFGGYDGQAVIWPDAPVLEGITMQLVTAVLGGRGVPSRRRVLRLTDLTSLRACFVANSLGVAPVVKVDNQALPTDPDFIRELTEAHDSIPWDPI